MIIVTHNYKEVKQVLNAHLKPVAVSFKSQNNITTFIIALAKEFKNDLIVWCHEDLINSLQVEKLSDIFHHQYVLATFNTDDNYYLSDKIEYLERSICLKFGKANTYGTYLMSSQVGAMHAQTILKLEQAFNINKSFTYNLNSIAKNYQIEGLYCYSEPKLLHPNYKLVQEVKISNSELFCFVREHYKWVWSWILLLNLIVFERKIPLIAFLRSCFINQKEILKSFNTTNIYSHKADQLHKHIDVVIPTIGRKSYLLNVLEDLKQQTILPKQVIIVEQNGDRNQSSELDYLCNQEWPFKITHKFTHTLGVCNARNTALQHLEHEWVFFADDDIRFSASLFEDTFEKITETGSQAINYSCLQPNQKQYYNKTGQTFIFGSGSSFVKASIAKQINFDTAFEFGFGEDTDYGAKIRQLGYDITFAPELHLTHLKAPIGGFRQPIPKLWDNSTIQPKPSPTMLVLFYKHFTTMQIKGYKLFLFIKMYGKNNPLLIFRNLKKFRKSWDKSVFYAKQLSQTINA